MTWSIVIGWTGKKDRETRTDDLPPLRTWIIKGKKMEEKTRTPTQREKKIPQKKKKKLASAKHAPDETP